MARPPQRSRKSSEHLNGQRIEYTRTLIVCEGETERNYLRDLKKDIRHTALTIKCTGTDPVTLVQDADKLSDQHRIAPENVWCVFDGEEHKDKFNEAIQKAKEKGFNIAYSNPCFELWYILHVKNQTANIHRHKTAKEVEHHFPRWNKPGSLFHEVIKNQPSAISRAKNGRKRQIDNGNPEWENPSTKVDLLVTHLNKAKKAFDG